MRLPSGCQQAKSSLPGLLVTCFWLDPSAFLKSLAKEKKCLFADLNADMQEALKDFPADAPKGKQLTSDGVHMNALGNYMMAKGVLRALGMTDKEIAAAESEWTKK